MNINTRKITITDENDPVEIAKSQEQLAKFDRNYSWLEAHAAEVFSHRGKHICIAGQQLFVGDDVKELLAQAKAAHPDDDGPLFRYIPKEKSARIYANRWGMACVRR
jgi:hypothetical protein